MFQIPHHILDRPMLLAGDVPQRPPVMLMRFQPDGVEQNVGRHMVGVGDERHAHPRADRLIFPVQMAGVPARPEPEDECPGYGHAKGYHQNE
jgi:hypothetical protein